MQASEEENAGRTRQFENPTIINSKCESATKIKAKEKYGRDLNRMFNEWLSGLIN